MFQLQELYKELIHLWSTVLYSPVKYARSHQFAALFTLWHFEDLNWAMKDFIGCICIVIWFA